MMEGTALIVECDDCGQHARIITETGKEIDETLYHYCTYCEIAVRHTVTSSITFDAPEL